MRARKEMSAIYHVTATDTWSVSSVYSYVDNEAHLSRFLLYNFLSRRVAKDAHILKSLSNNPELSSILSVKPRAV